MKQTTKTESRRVSTRLLLAVIVSAIFVSVVNQTFVNVVVPDIREDFGAAQGQVGWVITGYLLVFAVGIPLYGRIADLYSLRRTFCAGLLVFAAGSLACAFTPSLPLLVAGRILQAAGASSIPALGFASVAKVLPPGERGMALGLLSSSVGAGAAVGPVAGGAIAGLTGWQALFFATFTLALVLTGGALYVLPDAVSSKEGCGAPTGLAGALHHFDVPGGLSLALAAGLALFGVTQGQVVGFASPLVWGSSLAALLAGAYFARRIRRAPEPFVSPELFKNRAFLAAAVVGFFMMFANLGSLVLAPFLLSEVNGLSAASIGLVLAPGAVIVAVLSPGAGRLSDRLGPQIPIQAGLVTILLSMLFISTLGAGSSPVAIAAGILGQGIGFAAVNAPNANAASAALSRGESGVGLGIYQLLFFLGGGFGPAIAATFLALRREATSDALNPLYPLDAAPFSDAFLFVSVALLIALAASFGLRGSDQKQTAET